MSSRYALLSVAFVVGCAKAEAQPEMPGMPGMAMPEAPTLTSTPGHAHIALTPTLQERLDLQTATVQMHKLTQTLHVVGTVVPDETRTSHVHAKVRGWLETVPVNVTGQTVQEGEVLCTIYSPEVYAAELEFLSMLAGPVTKGEPGEFIEADRQVRSLTIGAARRRLQLWDVPTEEIMRLAKTRKPSRTFTLRAPRAGTIVAHQALVGMYADAATELYTVTDLNHVWIQLDVPAMQASGVRLGQQLEIAVQGQNAQPAMVTFVAPSIDQATRTVQIRTEINELQHQVRPGAFVTAQIDVDLGEGLAVPTDAVLWTGPRALVFVVLPTHLEPREVTVVNTAGGWTQVVGLQNGEKVATGSQFLIDAESRIRATSGKGGGHVH